ncbi:hypothetical protein COY27_06790 [Candidatus Woesearchaeota archaeon CG_4_10_14_0_2_um_filter_33_13]|nr:MAG: hypothetical protein COY27_06790 [Candidatus Woesearchaeota archaeon CG_4_10_14_0_2_um_filter_33_13]
MPEKKITGYQLKCDLCEYVWDTKYPRIPAKCPSCHSSIFNSNNYSILTEYVKGPCFIATAAYGTEFENQINILRYWRDRFLLKNYLGGKFVKIYYLISPPFAKYIEKSNFLKSLIRLLLNPTIKMLRWVYKK